MPIHRRAGNRTGARGSARRAGAHSSIPRGKRPLRAATGVVDGVSSRLAAARLQRLVREGGTKLHRGDTCRARLELRADGRLVQRGDPPVLRPFRAARTLEPRLRETAETLRLANGSRMPSIAEEVLAETHKPSLRIAGSRR